MKLLKHYVSDVHQKKVLPIAELRGRFRRQPNMCGVSVSITEAYKENTLDIGLDT